MPPIGKSNMFLKISGKYSCKPYWSGMVNWICFERAYIVACQRHSLLFSARNSEHPWRLLCWGVRAAPLHSPAENEIPRPLLWYLLALELLAQLWQHSTATFVPRPRNPSWIVRAPPSVAIYTHEAQNTDRSSLVKHQPSQQNPC